MGKKFMRRLLVLIAAMCMMITMAVPVLAEEDGETATVTGTTEDPANGGSGERYSSSHAGVCR